MINKSGSGAGIEGTISANVHTLAELKNVYSEWDTFTDEEKINATRRVDPVYSDTFYNVTTVGMHEYFVRNLDPELVNPEDNVSAAYLSLGDNGTGGTATTDTDLNNRVFSKEVTDHADNGTELLCSTFVGSTEANGATLDELGLFTDDPNNIGNPEVFLLNHSTFSPITKDDTSTITFDVTLTFSDI